MDEEVKKNIYQEDDERERAVDPTKYNKSVWFLLPALGLQIGYYSNMINCFIRDDNQKKYKDFHLFLLVKYKDEKYKGLDSWVAEYKTKNGGYMYVFKFPEHYYDDYMKFIAGAYSQFSAAYKDKIIRLLPKPVKDHNIFRVLMKSSEAKLELEEIIGQKLPESAELMSIPDMSMEIYKLKEEKSE